MLLIFSFLSLTSVPDSETLEDLQAIEKAIQHFVKKADQQDATALEAILHDEFRAIINGLFGSKEVSILSKDSYLAALNAGKIGGDQRDVQIHSISIDGQNAVVNATFTGKELTFRTFIQLVKEDTQAWKLISDMPVVGKKE